MNRLARAKPLTHFVFHSPSPRKFQRPIFYSTSTIDSPKTQQSSKPRTRKSSESYPSFAQRVKKEAEELPLRPRPREIPYQEKVSNLVNFIGHVKVPVKFIVSDGKQLAATIISNEQGGKNSLLIPVLFEDDLAHVVACHVKESDCVFVSGQLSVEPMRVVLSEEDLWKFHVVGNDLNFVEGFRRTVSAFGGTKKGAMATGVETDKPVSQVAKSIEEVKIYSDRGDDNVVNEFCREKGNEQSKETDSKKKFGDSWRDVIINPLQWWDYREHKSNGSVKGKFPDFKHKVSGEGLWLNTAPEWVLAGLGKLEFDVKPLFVKKQWEGMVAAGEVKKDGTCDDSWKNLVDNPDKWWDNRWQKRNPKSPDFKHKETGEALWVSRSPAWVVSKLPPSRGN